MSWKQFFFSFEGRINRKPFWLGSLALIGIVLVASLLAGFVAAGIGKIVSGSAGFAFVPMIAIAILMLYCSFAIAVKRLHDRNRSGWWVAFYYGASAVQPAAEPAWLSGTVENPTAVGLAIAVIVTIITIWYLVELGFLKGTQGPNRYGEDPLGAAQADASY